MDNAAYHIRIPKTSTAFELVQIDSVLHLSIVPCHVDNVCVTFMYMLDCRVNSKSLIFTRPLSGVESISGSSVYLSIYLSVCHHFLFFSFRL